MCELKHSMACLPAVRLFPATVRTYTKVVSRLHISQKQTVQLESTVLNYALPHLNVFINVILILMQLILSQS